MADSMPPGDGPRDGARADEPAPPGRGGGETDDATPQSATSDPLLEVEGLRKSFGGITALDGVDVTVGPGITGLIGPNGAGKTTLFNCLTGFHAPDAGTIRFRGADVTDDRPPAVAEQGLVRTFQIPRELGEMTVFDNLLLAPPNQRGERLTGAWLRGERFVADERAARERAREMAAFFELDHLLDDPASSLSGGQRKLLELARVLLTDPEVVLLDEPLAGVNPTLARKILARIHDLVDEGYVFLLVEHDIDVIMNNCERVVVMHRGQVLTTGTPAEVQRDDRVIEAYLGEVDV
jgi:branched-chain amino acid transport system ATP-binding protein